VYTAVSTKDVNSSTSSSGRLFFTVSLPACRSPSVSVLQSPKNGPREVISGGGGGVEVAQMLCK